MAVAAFTRQVLEFHRTGRLRVLVVTSPKRLAAAPQLPAVTEAGFPGLTAPALLGLLGPAATPTPVIEQVAQATRTALAAPAYQQSLMEGSFEPILDSNPEKFRQSLGADVAFWGRRLQRGQFLADF
jgi:tripartite-type tricarboxylate transporter receptor subunit TctC